MKKTLTLLMFFLTMVGTAKADVEWTIFSGSMAAGDWAKSLDADATWCKALEEGDQLVGTATIDTGKESDYSIQLYYGDTFISNFTYSEGTISYTLTATDITKLQTADKGMKLKGKNFTLTSLKVKKAKSAIKTTISATGSTGSWGSSVDFPENSLANAEKGDYVLVSLSSSASDSQGKVGMSSNGTDTYSFNNYVQAFAGIVTSDMAGESTKNGYVQGKNITVSGAALYHPLSSFSIGSIGYATFSASQQVTAPAGVKAYKATVDGSTVKLTQFTDNVIPANTGAIIAGAEGAVLEFTASSTEASETSDLIACTTATTISSLDSNYDYYILYNNPTGGNTYYGLGDSDLNTKWGDGTTYSNKVITFTESWKGCGWYLTADYSNYSKVVVEFESATTSGGRLVVDYDNNNTNYTDFTTGATSVEVVFDEEKKNSVKQIYFTSEAASASFTLSSAYIVSNAGSQLAEFRKAKTSSTLAANKAYLKISNSSSSSAPILKVVIDEKNSTTGIANVGLERRMKDDNRIFNLNGQEVKVAKSGLFIKNGKKYFVK